VKGFFSRPDPDPLTPIPFRSPFGWRIVGVGG
jgi:hypothetical protein